MLIELFGIRWVKVITGVAVVLLFIWGVAKVAIVLHQAGFTGPTVSAPTTTPKPRPAAPALQSSGAQATAKPDKPRDSQQALGAVESPVAPTQRHSSTSKGVHSTRSGSTAGATTSPTQTTPARTTPACVEGDRSSASGNQTFGGPPPCVHGNDSHADNNMTIYPDSRPGNTPPPNFNPLDMIDGDRSNSHVEFNTFVVRQRPPTTIPAGPPSSGGAPPPAAVPQL